VWSVLATSTSRRRYDDRLEFVGGGDGVNYSGARVTSQAGENRTLSTTTHRRELTTDQSQRRPEIKDKYQQSRRLGEILSSVLAALFPDIHCKLVYYTTHTLKTSFSLLYLISANT
jgi:hypothetical protein